MWISKILKSKVIIIATAVTLFCCDIYGQSDSLSIKIYFNQGSDILLDGRNIDSLNYAISSIKSDSLRVITDINIEGFSSPEGSLGYNDVLSEKRAEAVKQYLIDKLHLRDSLIKSSSKGVAWTELETIIKSAKPSKDSLVVRIIRTSPESLRQQELQRVDNGELYQYLFNSVYPRLRYAQATILSHRLEAILTPAIQPTQEIIYTIAEEPTTTSIQTPRPLFAIKTNLLFDLATAINLEVEIPIRERWSICAELIFPWWTIDNAEADSRRNRLQLLNGNIEARYWWRKNYSKPILTGWFCGVYSGVGSYDFEYRGKGYQGEFFVGVGVSGGYSHVINQAENLRMEYSIGVGYLETNYKYYHAEFCNNSCWHAIEQRSGKYLWFGPTRAKVSLSWLINRRQ